MARQQAWRTALSVGAWTAAITAGIALVGVASLAVSGWLIRGVEATNGDRRTAEERSSLGDYFGGVSAVFSGLALLLLVATLLFQQRELRMQRLELSLQRAELIASRDELHRSAEADLRTLHVQLTQMVMDDPSLAAVWNDFRREPDSALRQNLFANLTFNHYVLAYSWGSFSEDDLIAHAENLLDSSTFRRYWNATRAHKAQLSPDSPEGQVFQLFDRAFADRPQGTPPASP
ncbi:DUF6082 family protein [Streptomyces kanamyceticus]|uniref:DUF6082 family protein n=1 Tax=Streptomyces kanamyceticus TaxID=1967 RepID=UPI000ABAB37A|nr:DUF6082 family protein [Streptomyces kanamyceticus]